MEIQFVNFPEGMSLDSDLLLQFQIVGQTLSGETPKIDLRKIDDEETKVHVLVVDAPERMNGVGKMQLAWHILWFLHCHGLDKGADVRFAGSAEKGYFSIEDFPELLDKPHPSVK